MKNRVKQGFFVLFTCKKSIVMAFLNQNWGYQCQNLLKFVSWCSVFSVDYSVTKNVIPVDIILSKINIFHWQRVISRVVYNLKCHSFKSMNTRAHQGCVSKQRVMGSISYHWMFFYTYRPSQFIPRSTMWCDICTVKSRVGARLG